MKKLILAFLCFYSVFSFSQNDISGVYTVEGGNHSPDSAPSNIYILPEKVFIIENIMFGYIAGKWAEEQDNIVLLPSPKFYLHSGNNKAVLDKMITFIGKPSNKIYYTFNHDNKNIQPLYADSCFVRNPYITFKAKQHNSIQLYLDFIDNTDSKTKMYTEYSFDLDNKYNDFIINILPSQNEHKEYYTTKASASSFARPLKKKANLEKLDTELKKNIAKIVKHTNQPTISFLDRNNTFGNNGARDMVIYTDIFNIPDNAQTYQTIQPIIKEKVIDISVGNKPLATKNCQ